MVLSRQLIQSQLSACKCEQSTEKKKFSFLYQNSKSLISDIILIFANGPRSHDVIMFIDGYSDTHITFRWETSSGMDFVPNTLQMHPQYILTDMELSQSFTAYVAGTLPDTLNRKSEIYSSNCRLALVFGVLV